MSSLHPGVQYALAGGSRGALIGGLGGGAVGAYIGSKPSTDPQTGQQRSTMSRVGHGAMGAVGLGAVGASMGFSRGFKGRAEKWRSGFRPVTGPGAAPPPTTTPDWLAGAKTKAEGAKAYRAQARKVHPDLGGSPEAMKNLNAEWEAHEPHFKTAMYNAFADELEKIASLGALAGGAVGWKLSPDSAKGKIYGSLAGAAVGHMTEKGLTTAKRELLDRQGQYEREQLYGYTSPPNNPNY